MKHIRFRILKKLMH